MASIKLAYIGGGSTRAPGTVASFIRQAHNFGGSEIVLQDLDEDRLDLVCRLSRKMAAMFRAQTSRSPPPPTEEPRCKTVTACCRVTDPAALEPGCRTSAFRFLTAQSGRKPRARAAFSWRSGPFRWPKELVADMEALCPDALLFNYTNPVNIVAQAVADHSAIKVVSLCEGPIVFPGEMAELAGLDPGKVRATMLGLNHACWSAQTETGGAEYDGQPMIPLLAQKLEEGIEDNWARRWISLAVTMNSLPASYMKYYYFEGEMLTELQQKPTTRAQDILSDVPSYWQHYREQLELPNPTLEPDLSRGGIFELEVAVDVMDAVFNDKNEVWPTNVVNGGAIQDFPDSRVVEVPCLVNRQGVRPLSGYRVPPPVRGLLSALGEYQQLAADAAWNGTRKQALQALTSNPLVRTLPLAQTLYTELSAAHRNHLPERLW